MFGASRGLKSKSGKLPKVIGRGAQPQDLESGQSGDSDVPARRGSVAPYFRTPGENTFEGGRQRIKQSGIVATVRRSSLFGGVVVAGEDPKTRRKGSVQVSFCPPRRRTSS